ncbi:hypothetical protein KEH51_23650 [[Brevibacterium] frigoritolerans]|uniref:Uncharacterized protein n=1 Tax=Peribacillus frigoritolerans TaxID=450367 RepID=A0A941FSL1_9BACI|nr:hypothetical protein [Peribacillus frigoritolerans]
MILYSISLDDSISWNDELFMELTNLVVLVIISSKDFTKTLISSFPLTLMLLISLLAVNKSPFEISYAAKLTLRSRVNF